MRWEKSPPKRMAKGSIEDWDLILEDQELEVVGFVSLMKGGAWRAMPLVGDGMMSMHLTKEEAQEACVAALVAWRISQ